VRWTFAELDRRADRAAAALHAHGVGRGDHVALALRNSPEYLELMLGAFKLAAVPVNVNYRYQGDELVHVLGDCEARVVLHEPELAALLQERRHELSTLATLVAR